MALVDRWYKFAGMTSAGFQTMYSAQGNLPTFEPVVTGLGIPADYRIKATINTSFYDIAELDAFATQNGWVPSTAPIL
jgi:hypothetical protein